MKRLSAQGGYYSCCCRVVLQATGSGTVQRFLPRGVGPVVDGIEDSIDDVVRTLTVQIAELTGPSH